MAKDAANHIVYYMCVAVEHKEDLALVRSWSNLKVGFDDRNVWVKDFDYNQIDSVQVKQIPYKKLYCAKEEKLYPLGSSLPSQVIPSLLWSPIERGLPVRLPSFNHNFFGVGENITINIVPTEKEETVVAMLTDVETLKQYITTAPAHRLQCIQWVIVDSNKVFLKGAPILPIEGKVFWQRKNMLLPAGYDFEFHILSDTIARVIENHQSTIVVWDETSNYFLINNEDMRPLSISSFRISFLHEQKNNHY